MWRTLFRNSGVVVLAATLVACSSSAAPSPATPSGAPTAVAGRAIASMSFLDLDTGYGLTSNGAGLATTHDGGMTWTAVATAADTKHTALWQPDSGVVASASKAVWVWGPPINRGAPNLAVSRDGGRRWSVMPGMTNVVNVVAAGTSLWAASSPTDGSAPTLWRSADRGSSWQPAPPLPAGGNRILGTSRGSEVSGFLFVGSPSSTGPPFVLATSDNGTSWTQRSVPPTCGYEGAFLAASGPAQPWLACGSSVGVGGSQVIDIYRSTDDGASWQLRATNAPGGQGPLPTGGGLTGLYPISANVAYAGLTHGGVIETTDGGITWTTATKTPTSPLGSLVAPVDTDTSVALVAGQSWHTTNGTSWTPTSEVRDTSSSSSNNHGR